jgi:hypothetical protein
MQIFCTYICPVCKAKLPRFRVYSKLWYMRKMPCPECGRLLQFRLSRRRLLVLLLIPLTILSYVLKAHYSSDWVTLIYIVISVIVLSCEVIVPAKIPSEEDEATGNAIANERDETIQAQMQSWKGELVTLNAEKETLIPQKRQRRLILAFASAGTAITIGTIMTFICRDFALFAGLLGIAVTQIVTRVCFLFSLAHQENTTQMRVVDKQLEEIWSKING